MDAPGLTLSVFVPGDAIAKGRPRFGRGGRAYTPKRTVEWEEYVLFYLIASRHAPFPPLEPLALDLEFLFKRKKLPGRKRSTGIFYDPESVVWHVRRPDVDNLAKGIMDALVKSGIICDDKQIAGLVVVKKWATMHDPPGTRILLRAL
jgi:Holliday junction resolvase RusA-like endonuclease